jgi:hypothetical protein
MKSLFIYLFIYLLTLAALRSHLALAHRGNRTKAKRSMVSAAVTHIVELAQTFTIGK